MLIESRLHDGLLWRGAAAVCVCASGSRGAINRLSRGRPLASIEAGARSAHNRMFASFAGVGIGVATQTSSATGSTPRREKRRNV